MKIRMGWVSAALVALLAVTAVAGAVEPVATGQLQLQGSRLTIYREGARDDADQTLNINEAGQVRTCFGGGATPCGSISPGDPRVAGLEVLGELSGPELPTPLPLQTIPGGSFLLPGLSKEGDYRLSNIRLVESGTGRIVGPAEPSVATIHVRQILLASATVTRLGLADLQTRGIAISAGNFQAFGFSVGFAFGSEIVNVELPVLYSGNGMVGALDQPTVSLEGLSEETAHAVERWNPPFIVPFKLEVEPREFRELDAEEQAEVEVPLFGAIVIPGNLSFLNQFFEARLLVLNGAGPKSRVELGNVGGTLRLPSGNVIRLAATDPPVLAGQKLPVEGEHGERTFGPGEQGSATWTVEGLKAGTHVLKIDLEADILRLDRDPLPTRGSVQAAVEVVDARFHLTFNHPDVVREGEQYSLFVTVTNLSRVRQELITVELTQQELSGAKFATGFMAPGTIPGIDPGESETVEFRLESLITGKCVATAFQTDSSGASATIKLRAGVSDEGVPLSPATLVLPRFSELLPKPLLDANVRFLGLAYSMAVAPAGMLPVGLPAPGRTSVERRAIDLGEAGQRLFLREKPLESLEALALDQLGNRQPLEAYDELRRKLDKGRRAGVALGDLLRAEQEAGSDGRSFSASELLGHLAETMSYARPFLAATVTRTGPVDPPTLEIRRTDAGGESYLAYTNEQTGLLRSLPFGEIYSISETPGSTTRAPLAIVGHLEPKASYRILLHAGNAPAAGRLHALVPVAASMSNPSGFAELDFGSISMEAGAVYEVHVVAAQAGPAITSFPLVWASTQNPVLPTPPTPHAVALPDFRIIGAVQDFRMGEGRPDFYGNVNRPNRYGNGVAYLFNRPPTEASAEVAASYRLTSLFNGFDVKGNQLAPTSPKKGEEAFWQPNSERVVYVRFDSPVSPLTDANFPNGLMTHTHSVVPGNLRDAWGNPVDAVVPPIVTEPNRFGGLIEGKVVRGTGDPVAGARVELIRRRRVKGIEDTIVFDRVGEMETNSEGRFYFDFIEEPSQDPAVESGILLRAHVPATETEPEQTEEISTVIRQQNKLAHVVIALLGRGKVGGRLVYDDTGLPVSTGEVSIASTLFGESRKMTVAADGSFWFVGVPVGPLSLSGRDDSGNRVWQTVGLGAAGAVVSGVELRLPRAAAPRFGTVLGTVFLQRSGSPLPLPEVAAGARVAVYSEGRLIEEATTGSDGGFRFDQVPAGQVTVQAADWSVSRTPTLTNLTLAADSTSEVTLILASTPKKAVEGRVVYFDGPTNRELPVQGATVFVEGPGLFSYTDSDGNYRIDDLATEGVSEAGYRVTAIDFGRKLQGSVSISLRNTAGDLVTASKIVLRSMTGGLQGIVYDPLGQPVSNAKVAVTAGAGTSRVFVGEATTSFDGRWSLGDLPLGGYNLAAHVGNGLQAEKVGFFGSATATIVFGGHVPFTTIRMVGSGIVRIRTTASSGGGTPSGVMTPIYYRPNWFSEAGQEVAQKVSAIEASTNPNGDFELFVPVGPFSVKAYNPFYGTKEQSVSIEYAGQIQEIPFVFDSSTTTVNVQVVNVDGVTPVGKLDVALSARGFLPQTHTLDDNGMTTYTLIPPGPVTVTAAGRVGTVDRVGIAEGWLGGAGQTLDLTVRMKPVGTVHGTVQKLTTEGWKGIAGVKFYVVENDHPHRRLPVGTDFYRTGDEGVYEVSGVNAGRVTVVALDPDTIRPSGRVSADLATDFQDLEMPTIRLSTSVGTLSVVVRDPETGATVPDCQITASFGEMTVGDSDGQATFEAIPLGTYSVYAFHAPTGRGGRVDGLRLATGGQTAFGTITLNQRGRITGTVLDGATPVAGATVRLSGSVAGRLWSSSLTALATTGTGTSLGRFEFDGIPEGSFTLTAGVEGSPRRAVGTTTLSALNIERDLDLVLEPIATRSVRLFEKLSTNPLHELNPAEGIASVRLQQAGYDYTLSSPTTPWPGHRFAFPEVLMDRELRVTAQELSGEQRASFLYVPKPSLETKGSESSPYELLLGAKGVVTVTVRDAGSAIVPGAGVSLSSTGGGTVTGVTGGDGTITFVAIPAGVLTARANFDRSSGSARGSLVFDDDRIGLEVSLSASALAHGIVSLPVPNDDWNGDLALLQPAPGAVVTITDALGQQSMVTLPDGSFGFAGLAIGSYVVEARGAADDSYVRAIGTLLGPNGTDQDLGPLVLDAAPPRVVSISPAPGATDVSLFAPVEIVFSEALLPAVLPSGPSSPFFMLKSASGASAVGIWSSPTESNGKAVRFAPSTLYGSSTTYSLVLTGGANGIRDRQGRPLNANGNVGSNFTTADRSGPKVIATSPDLSRPVDPTNPVRFDFNEIVSVASGQSADVVQLVALDAAGAESAPLDATATLTRGGYSLSVQARADEVPANDTYRRRIRIRNLVDQAEPPNSIGEYQRDFRIRDGIVPTVSLSAPGDSFELLAGQSYTLVPALGNLQDVSATNAAGDLDRVEYYLTDPSVSGATPTYVARRHPFAFTFVASNSATPPAVRPFTVWARAVDTSTNLGDSAPLPLVVLPNSAPAIDEVSLVATAPTPNAFYPGTWVSASAARIEDVDGLQMTISAELRRLGTGALLASSTPKLVTKPAEGWGVLPVQTFSLRIPLDVPPETEVGAVVQATDSLGAVTRRPSTSVTLLADQGDPTVQSVQAIRMSGTSGPVFVRGDRFLVEVAAVDGETAVQSVSVEITGEVLAGVYPLTAVAGKNGVYRSATFEVPFDLAETKDLVARADVRDLGGNVSSLESAPIVVGPSGDTSRPTVEWLTPWEGALWPAGYGTGGAVPFLVRLRIADNEIADDDKVHVWIRGPLDATTTSDWLPASRLADGASAGAATFEALWPMPGNVPDGTILSFEVRVSDTAGDVHSVARMRAVRARAVFQQQTLGIAASNPLVDAGGDANGPVFLLDGSEIGFAPLAAGVRSLTSLYVYAGGDASSGSLVVHPSIIAAPYATSHSETTEFFPLELGMTDFLGLGSGCRIDMSGKGLLGGQGTLTASAAGESPAESLAGGSHGGQGGPGSPYGSWDRDDLEAAGEVFDSVRDPKLPGGGGGAGSGGGPGGQGGGVIRIVAPGAVVHLEGDLLADGRTPGGIAGGGAGGAIRMIAGRLEGRGRISANGGDGTNASYAGGGGGGRIAISVVDAPSDEELDARTSARGGGDYAGFPASVRHYAGAGTIFVERLDAATGAPEGLGKLLVANSAERPAHPTPIPMLGEGVLLAASPEESSLTLDRGDLVSSVAGEWIAVTDGSAHELGLFRISSESVVSSNGVDHLRLAVDGDSTLLATIRDRIGSGEPLRYHGRSRLANVTGRGQARLLFGDEVEIGGALDDPTSVELDPQARVALRTDLPEIRLSLTHAGETLELGQPITVNLAASDSLGVRRIEEQWTGATASVSTYPTDEPSTVASPVRTIAAPAVGTFSYVAAGRSVSGRETRVEKSLTVVPNALPLASATVTPLAAYPGHGVAVKVHAEDRDGIRRITVRTVAGTTVPTERIFDLSNPASTDATASFLIAATAPATPDVDFVVEIVDGLGNTTTLDPIRVDVLPDSAPPVIGPVTGLDPDRTYRTGELISGWMSIVDEGLVDPTRARVELRSAGSVVLALPLSGSGESWSFSGTIPSIASRTDVQLVVLAADYFHPPVEATAAALVLRPVGSDSQAPTLTIERPAGSTLVEGTFFDVMALLRDDSDLGAFRVLLDGQVVFERRDLYLTASHEQAWVQLPRLPEGASTGSAVLRVEVEDGTGNLASEERTLTITPDAAPPQSFIAFPAAVQTIPAGTRFPVMVEAKDDGSVVSVEVRVNGESVPVRSFGAQADVVTSTLDELVAPDPSNGGEATWTIEARAVDATGKSSAPFVRSVRFVPASPEFRVVSVTPFDGQERVGLERAIRLKTTLEMAPESLSDATIVLRNPALEPIPLAITKLGSGREVVLQPLSPLQPGTTYRFEVTAGVLDLAGRSLPAQTTSFTTATRTIHVDAGYAGLDSDGSAARPYLDVAAAVAAATGPADVIRLEPSRNYTLAAVVPVEGRSVAIEGSGPEATTVGSTGTLFVLKEGSLMLDGLRIEAGGIARTDASTPVEGRKSIAVTNSEFLSDYGPALDVADERTGTNPAPADFSLLLLGSRFASTISGRFIGGLWASERPGADGRVEIRGCRFENVSYAASLGFVRGASPSQRPWKAEIVGNEFIGGTDSLDVNSADAVVEDNLFVTSEPVFSSDSSAVVRRNVFRKTSSGASYGLGTYAGTALLDNAFDGIDGAFWTSGGDERLNRCYDASLIAGNRVVGDPADRSTVYDDTCHPWLRNVFVGHGVWVSDGSLFRGNAVVGAGGDGVTSREQTLGEENFVTESAADGWSASGGSYWSWNSADLGGGRAGSRGGNRIFGNGLTSGFDLMNGGPEPLFALGNAFDHTAPWELESLDLFDDDDSDQWNLYGRIDFTGALASLADAPPTGRISSPAEGRAFRAGTHLRARFEASDDWGVASVTLRVDGVDVETRSGSFEFDLIVPSDRATLTLGGRITDVAGQSTNVSDLSLSILPNGSPTIALIAPADGATVTRGTAVRLRATASDDDGLAEVDFYAGTRLLSRDTAPPWESVLDIADTDVEPITLTAVAVDSSGSSTTSAPATISTAAGSTFVVAVQAPANGVSIEEGALATLVARASGASRVDFYLDETLVGSDSTGTPVGRFADFSIQARFPVHVSSSRIQVVAFASTGESVEAERVVPVSVDVVRPVVTDAGFSASRYPIAWPATLTFQVVATDDVLVSLTEVRVNGAPVSGAWPVPKVSVATSFEYRAVAVDLAGNVSDEWVGSIDVVPTDGPEPPTLSIVSPTTGAWLPNESQWLAVEGIARDDSSVTRVDVYVGSAITPTCTTLGASSGRTEQAFWCSQYLSSPVSPLTIRVRTTDSSGQTTEATSVITLVDAVAVDRNRSDWDSALGGRFGLLRGGTLVTSGTRNVAGLILLDNASIQAPAPTLANREPQPLSIHATSGIYVGRGCAIDVSGAGYAGGLTAANPGSPQGMIWSPSGASVSGGAQGGYGASHGGLGNGGTSFSGATYGSALEPATAGAGGGGIPYPGYPAYDTLGLMGGGVLAIDSPSLINDGALRANGAPSSGWGVGGAGGSLRIAVGRYAGLGLLEARGSVSSGPAAGGGRIAIRTGVGGVASETVSTAPVDAAGGNGLGAGAGSVVLFREGGATPSIFGDLRIDGKWRVPAGWTELPALANGYIESWDPATSTATVVESPRAFDILGSWLEVRYQQSAEIKGLYRIVGYGTPDGKWAAGNTRLVLDAAGLPPLSPWDLYIGVRRFDSVTVTGGAVLRSQDPIIAPGWNRPTATLTPDPQWQGLTVAPGDRVIVRARAADVEGLESVHFMAVGAALASGIDRWESISPNGALVDRVYEVDIPTEAAEGSQFDALLGSVDSNGQIALSETLHFVVQVPVSCTGEPPAFSGFSAASDWDPADDCCAALYWNLPTDWKDDTPARRTIRILRDGQEVASLPATLFADDFENGLDRWTLAGDWALVEGGSTALGHQAVKLDVHSGSCATLTSEPITLPPNTANVQIHAAIRVLTDPFDSGFVVQVAAGPAFSNWRTLQPWRYGYWNLLPDTAGCIVGTGGAWSGDSSGFLDAQIPFDEGIFGWDGGQLKLRFTVWHGAEGALPDEAVWIDDVRVEPELYVDHPPSGWISSTYTVEAVNACGLVTSHSEVVRDLVGADGGGPEVKETHFGPEPEPGGIFRSGMAVHIGYRVLRAVRRALEVDGSTWSDDSSGEDGQVDWTVPEVSAPTPVHLALRFWDAQGVSTTVEFDETITPRKAVDECAGAIQLPTPAADGTITSWSGDLSGLTFAATDPVPSHDLGWSIPDYSRTAWFRLDPTVDGTYFITLGRSRHRGPQLPDSWIAIFEGGECGRLGPEVMTGEDGMALAPGEASTRRGDGLSPACLFEARAGVTYWIVVGLYDWSEDSPLDRAVIDVRRTDAKLLRGDRLLAGVGSGGTLGDDDNSLGLRASYGPAGQAYTWEDLLAQTDPVVESFAIAFDDGTGRRVFANDGPTVACGNPITMTPSSKSLVPGGQAIRQSGSIALSGSPGSALELGSEIALSKKGSVLRFDVTLRNAGSSRLTDVAYLRSVRPNFGPEVWWYADDWFGVSRGDVRETQGHGILASAERLNPPSVGTSGFTLGVGTFEGLIGDAPRPPRLGFAGPIPVPWEGPPSFQCDPANVSDPGFDPNGVDLEDRETDLLFPIGSLAPGEERRLSFYYLLASGDMALADAAWAGLCSAAPSFGGLLASSGDVDCGDTGVRLDWDRPSDWGDAGVGPRELRLYRGASRIATIPAAALEDDFEGGLPALWSAGNDSVWFVAEGRLSAGSAPGRCVSVESRFPVSIAPAPVRTELRFRSWNPAGPTSGGWVEASTGSGWVAIEPIGGYPATLPAGSSCDGVARGVLSGGDGSESAVAFDLSAFAGQSIRIRLRASSGGGVTSPIWSVDDLWIGPVGYVDDGGANAQPEIYRVEAVGGCGAASDGGVVRTLTDVVGCPPVAGPVAPSPAKEPTGRHEEQK